MPKWLLTAGLALIAVPVLGSPLLDRFFNRMTFQPMPGVHADAEALGVPVEELWLTTEDGVRLHAFYLPRPNADRAVLFLHGNYGNAHDRLPFARELAALDINVLLIDYRGYGFSEGAPDEPGIYRDADAGLRELIGHRGFDPERVVLMGRSLGGAAAVDAATRQAVAGVVLISTPESARAMARSIGLGLLAPLVGRRLDSAHKIGDLTTPLLMFHGDEDEIVPVGQGKTLFERAREPKTLHLIRGARHNDIIEVAGDDFWEPLGDFLDQVAP